MKKKKLFTQFLLARQLLLWINFINMKFQKTKVVFLKYRYYVNGNGSNTNEI